MLIIKNYNVSYGAAVALRDANLTVESGEIVGVIGPNGAGKTSLLRGISGLATATGVVRFNEIVLSGRSPRLIASQGVIQCPQAGQLFQDMTVLDNLRLGAFLRPKNIVKLLDRVFEIFPEIHKLCARRANTLSGGERQIVALGRALMATPKLLLLDEPSLGLAPVVKERIKEALSTISRMTELSVLLVEQDTELAMEIAERFYILDSGEIVSNTDRVSIMDDPKLKGAYLGVV